MGLGDRWQILLDWNVVGEEAMNVFYYEQILGADTDANTLTLAFQDQVMGDLLDIVHNTTFVNLIAARDLDDPTAFYVQVEGPLVIGTRGGECMPPFVAWAFRYNRATTLVRNGQKRIPGVSEADQNAGVALSTFIPTLNIAAAAMAADLVDDNGSHYRPVIMRKVFDELTGITTYTQFPFSTVEYTRVSTQNTRKFGRGS